MSSYFCLEEKNSSLIIILLSQNYESNFEDINQTLSQWSSNLQQLNLQVIIMKHNSNMFIVYYQMTTTLITTHTLFSDMETRLVLPVLTKYVSITASICPFIYLFIHLYHRLYTQYNNTDWFLLAKQNTIINFSLLTKLLKNYKVSPHAHTINYTPTLINYRILIYNLITWGMDYKIKN